MAFIDQEKKKELYPLIMAVCKKYGVKATLGIKHYSTLVLTVRSGVVDFGAANDDINTYKIEERFTGPARDFLLEVHALMNLGNHDNSNLMIDYFDVGWYTTIRIGEYNKPYKLIQES